ncbi:hypothetical protein [Persicitalea jodogahamensis]|uniref:Lipoprotein n=1 Tax=Persicitalea jodogahamensis TaxID=402147 RepID=A0A8J3D7U5_9BACT|nr:hypothetical protein [Persicitalea jodogahamensis]GHB64557.1 hypothetical protein GCM10007390_18110 [Persicitalea jodogahamensis]
MKTICSHLKSIGLRASVLLFLVSTGCNSKVRYQSQLLLKNELDVPIEVTIHPKPSLLFLGGYKSSPSEGGTFSQKFTLLDNGERAIYYDTKLGIEPAKLASSVFDSITVVVGDTVLRLRLEQTANYTLSPFESNENWTFAKVEFDAATQFKRNPVQSDNFYFVIKEENIVR